MKNHFQITMKMFTWLALVHSLLFILFWVTNVPFQEVVNDFVTDMTGMPFNYVLILILLSALMAVWCLVRLIFGKKQAWALGGTMAHFVICIIYIVSFYALFIAMFLKDPTQPVRLLQLFNFFRPFIEVPLLILFVVLTLPFVARAFHARREQPPYAVILAAMWLFAWSFSLWNPPDSVYRGNLPDKPALIAHRGASSLAPENTLAAVRMAGLLAERGVVRGPEGLTLGTQNPAAERVGVETDIRISQDGVLFLMHDDTLKRTTNVAEIFPSRLADNASGFTIAELKKLSAGQWFAASHPAGSLPIGLVSETILKTYATEPIPTLQEWLQIVKKDHLIFIFDLLPPPEDHPYYDQFVDTAFKQIKNAKIDDQIWFLVDEDTYWKVCTSAGSMQLVDSTDYRNPPSVAILQFKGIHMLNSGYGLPVHWIREYQAAHIKINLWTVDERWQFSRLWVLGIDSVTTNNLPVFMAETSPYLPFPITIS